MHRHLSPRKATLSVLASLLLAPVLSLAGSPQALAAATKGVNNQQRVTMRNLVKDAQRAGHSRAITLSNLQSALSSKNLRNHSWLKGVTLSITTGGSTTFGQFSVYTLPSGGVGIATGGSNGSCILTYVSPTGSVNTWSSSTGTGTCYGSSAAMVGSGGTIPTGTSGPTATTQTVAPAAPTNLTGTAGNASVSLSWTPDSASNISGYQVYQNSVLVQTVTSPTSTATLTGLTNGTTYSFYVTAVDTSGNVSSPSNTISLTPTAATNLSTSSWTQLAPMTTPRFFEATAVDPNGYVYVMGGVAAGSTGGALSSVERYDPSTNTWSALAPLPQGMAGATATYSDGYIWFFGGNPAPWGANNPQGEVYRYDISANTWTQVATDPVPSVFASIAVGQHGNIYVVGGAGAKAPDVYTTNCYPLVHCQYGWYVRKYYPATNAFGNLSFLPQPLAFTSAVVDSNNKLTVMGGYNSNNVYQSAVLQYDAAAQSWSGIASLPAVRFSAGAGMDGSGNIYDIGGVGPTLPTGGNVIYSSTAEYNLSTGTWGTGPVLPAAVHDGGVVTNSSGQIYEIGGLTSTGVTGQLIRLG